MAKQIDVANHLDLSDRQVRNLIKSGALPGSKGPGGYDIDACRVAYIRHLRGLATGQTQGGGRIDLAEKKQQLEVDKLQHQVDELARMARKDDRLWVRHDDHCSSIAAILGVLKENLQHYCTIKSTEIVDVSEGDTEKSPMVADFLFDNVVSKAFNDLSGVTIENAIFDVYSNVDDEEE